jgi:ABC-type amino acid transport substrate-binding protein
MYLREVGFPDSSIQEVSSLAQNFQKLDQGRIDLIALSRDSGREYLRMKGLDPKLYRSYALLSSNPNYYAFSLDSPDALIERFAQALRGLAKERAAILEAYGMEP